MWVRMFCAPFARCNIVIDLLLSVGYRGSFNIVLEAH